MTRKKVKLAFITNDASRKATFKKRKKGLMKKVSELSTLCGIDACAIIYSPYESQPEVWPNTSGAQRVLGQFKRMPEMEQSKKMVNQESFIRQRIAKVNEQLKKQLKENREKELTEVMYQCLTGKGIQNLVITDLNDLAWLIDVKLKEICKRIELLKSGKDVNKASAVTSSGGAGGEVEALGNVGKGKSVVLREDEQKPVVDLGSLEQAQRAPLSWFNNVWGNNGANNNEQQQQQQQQAQPQQHLGFVSREEMLMLPFGDGHVPGMWSGGFFP